MRERNTHIVDTWDEFVKILEEKPGFIYAHWDGTNETEKLIKEKQRQRYVVFHWMLQKKMENVF